MLSFSQYQKMYGGKTPGRARKEQSDLIMEATWGQDIASQVGYLYDFSHDSHRTELRCLDPTKDPMKIPISLKFLRHTSQTYAKDIVTQHIQLMPSQVCNVPYYDEVFAKRYDAVFPNGLYVDLMDARGVYNRWLVVGFANYYDNQFPNFEVLPCDYIFQWIYENKRYQMAGVLRSQNSYNSGVWEDFKIETVCWRPYMVTYK